MWFATDPPHQLKRYRRQISSDQLEFTSIDSFIAISAQYPEVLPSCVIESENQTQSVPLAYRLIHLTVQEKALELGFKQDAAVLKVLEGWTNGLDKRGLKLSQRRYYLGEMDKFLLSLLTTSFSMEQACASHICGMSQELFEEGLIINECFRSVCDNLDENVRIEFNSRVLSTDPAESYFSVLKSICKKPTVRLVLQAWRTVGREHRKQLNPSRGYCRRISLHASYYQHELNLNTWNLPEGKDITELSPVVQAILKRHPRKNILKHGKKRTANEADPNWKSIREVNFKKR